MPEASRAGRSGISNDGLSEMLSLAECIDYVKQWGDEIESLSKHDYAPSLIAAEMQSYAAESPAGEQMLESVILDDMSEALANEDFELARKLLAVMTYFIETHPDNPRASPPLPDRSE